MQAVRIRQSGNSLAITLPSPYAKQLGWHLGDYLVLEIVDLSLVVRSLPDAFRITLRTHTQTTEADNATTQS